jgi:hypothetical protein
MTGYELETKLKKLNPLLYLGRTEVDYFNGELGSTGIYLKRRSIDAQKIANEADHTNFIKKDCITAGAMRNLRDNDEYLGMTTLRHIPEGNQYLPDQSLWAKGWREIVLAIVKRGHCTLERARRVFECPSLGQSDWDRMSDLQKFATHHFSQEQIREYLCK